MTCQTCGRPAENGQPTHWLGCEALFPKVEPAEVVVTPDQCEHPECPEPRKPWSGKGAKPKYCAAGHKKEK